MSAFDVLILGGGIVGCACARECTAAGLRVGLVEQGVVGGGATAAAMGHIVLMDDSPAQLSLTHYSRALWKQMQDSLPAAAEYETSGTLWIAADYEEMAEVYAKQEIYAAVGAASVVMSAAELAAAEPNLRHGLAGALLVPDDAVLYPPAAAMALFREAIQGGAVLLQGHAAVALNEGAVTLQNGSTYTAGHIIVASGTDTRLLPWLPIQKRKGHLLITDRYPGFLHHQLVELGYLKSAHTLDADSTAFNIQPRKTGQLLIGSSRQYGNEDTGVDPQILAQMIERAHSYMPALAQLSGIRVWTGFRAATPDKLPLIGPTDVPSVLLAAGFEGLGITSALGAARILTDHLLNRPSAIDTAPFLPSRFACQGARHA